jgi:hypothetical protein|tara:strand:- start:2397 stop:2696 length:300 start_codon:yes stop_codon:yes gene_type:complete
MVNWLYIVGVVIAAFIFMEYFKHHFVSKISKLIILFFLIALVSLASSGYLLENNLLKTDNKLIITSAAVFSDIKDRLDESELFNSVNTTNFLDTRKIYK